jgi:hypothetical protein
MSSNLHPKPSGAEWLRVVQEQLSSLRYGVVQIVVHDAHVVQIERTEKVRLDRTDNRTTPITGAGALTSNHDREK